MAEIIDLGERLLRLAEVRTKVGLGASTIYRRMAAGTFPRPLTLGDLVVRWRASDVDAWIDALPRATAQTPPPTPLPSRSAD